MKGSKGGFWNLLLERFRMRRIKKKKIKNEEQKLNDLKTIKEINNKQKKEKEIIVNYYIKEKNKKYKLEKTSNKVKIKNPEKIIVVKPQKKKVGINLNEIEKKNIIKENKETEIKQKEIKKEEKHIRIESKNNQKEIKQENKTRKTETNHPNCKKEISQPIEKQKEVENNSQISKVKASNQDLENTLIKELKKITGKDRDELQNLGFKLDELNSKLDNAKTIEEINKIEKEIQEIIKQINEIINNYNAISNGNYKKLNNEKINNVLSKVSNTNMIIDIKNKLKNELDYYSKIVDTKKNIFNIQNKKGSKKQNINNKIQLFSYENSELSNISNINKQLNVKLKEQQDIYKEFNDLITNIKADKIVSTKYSFVDRMLNGATSIMTGAFSLKLMKQKNIPFFALGLFILGNSIRNMRKVVKKDETIKYIPSDDYAKEIESNMSNFYLIDYMLNDTLYQVSRLKYEYMDEFKNYHGLDSYEKNLDKIINIEKQIINKQKQVNTMKNKMYDTLDKNNQKIKIIKDMNK
ncbi:MAG: hypothetical protein IJO32_04835 [Bacilli bacterium]|nr:hypothetical protein [Bacilli bacterium]